LHVSGVAPEIEVERVFNTLVDPNYCTLQVAFNTPRRRLETLWRQITLPGSVASIVPSDAPRLLVGPEDSLEDTPELEARVTDVAGDYVDLDIGARHGLGPGDLVQILASENYKWVGTGVIQTTAELHSKALYMGEEAAAKGDVVKVRFHEY
jgi:hypothetical protein